MAATTRSVARRLPGFVLRAILIWVLLSVIAMLGGSVGSVELTLFLLVAVVGAALWTFVLRR